MTISPRHIITFGFTTILGLLGSGVLDAQNSPGMTFYPVAPCLISDTRISGGGPAIAGQTTRTYDILNSSCGIPSTAMAYSLSIGAFPAGALGYLTVWPSGQMQPNVSILNSDGRAKVTSAILEGGSYGKVSVFASNTTDLAMWIDGYFAAGSSGQQFNVVPPCRITDTRPSNGLLAGEKRAMAIAGSCGVPSTATAYFLNITSVPIAGSSPTLTAWASGSSKPGISTIINSTGTVIGRAGIIAAGGGGSIDVSTTQSSDVIIDVSGYFAPPATGGLLFFPQPPCRIFDTRTTSGGLFSGTISVPDTALGCFQATGAQAYLLNATVVPQGPLGYLTIWPQNIPQPGVATLNAPDGAVTSNLAITATGSDVINAFASNPTQLVADTFGFFSTSKPPATPLNSPSSLVISTTNSNVGEGTGTATPTFTFHYSDPNGVPNMYRGDIAFLGPNGFTCDIGWGANGELAVFSAYPVQSGRVRSSGSIGDQFCTIQLQDSSIQPSTDGTTLDVAIKIQFNESFWGPYLVLTDVGDVNGLTTTLAQVGTWNVTRTGPNQPANSPTSLTISPGNSNTASGTGSATPTFTFHYSDPNGVSRMYRGDIGFKGPKGTFCNVGWGSNGDVLVFSASKLISGVMGQPGSIGDQMCTIILPGSSVQQSTDGTTLDVKLELQFNQAYQDKYFVLTDVGDTNGLSTTLANVGEYTVTQGSGSPKLTSLIIDNAGNIGTGYGGTGTLFHDFTFQYSSPNGSHSLTSGGIYFTGPSGNTCFFGWTNAGDGTGQIVLSTGAATALGNPGKITPSGCAIDTGASSISAFDSSKPTILILVLRISFDAVAVKTSYVINGDVQDAGNGKGTSLTNMGTWNTLAPVLVSMLPLTIDNTKSSAAGGAAGPANMHSFTFQYSDTSGTADILAGNVTFVDVFQQPYCSVSWLAAGTISLLNQTAPLHVANQVPSTIADRLCTVDPGRSFLSEQSGTILTLTLYISFSQSLSGDYTIMTSFKDKELLSTSNSRVGSWNVDVKSDAPPNVSSSGSMSSTVVQENGEVRFYQPGGASLMLKFWDSVNGLNSLRSGSLQFSDPLGNTPCNIIWTWNSTISLKLLGQIPYSIPGPNPTHAQNAFCEAEISFLSPPRADSAYLTVPITVWFNGAQAGTTLSVLADVSNFQGITSSRISVGNSFTIYPDPANTQHSPPPSYPVTIYADPLNFDSNEQPSGFRVMAPTAKTDWTASSSATWLVLQPGLPFKGSGSFQFTLMENKSPLSRTATITVNGSSISIMQTGKGSSDPSNNSLPAMTREYIRLNGRVIAIENVSHE